MTMTLILAYIWLCGALYYVKYAHGFKLSSATAIAASVPRVFYFWGGGVSAAVIAAAKFVCTFSQYLRL